MKLLYNYNICLDNVHINESFNEIQKSSTVTQNKLDFDMHQGNICIYNNVPLNYNNYNYYVQVKW